MYHKQNHLESHQLVQQPTWTSIGSTIIRLTTIGGGSPEPIPISYYISRRARYRVSIRQVDTVPAHTPWQRVDWIHRQKVASHTASASHCPVGTPDHIFFCSSGSSVSAKRVFRTCRWIKPVYIQFNHELLLREGGWEGKGRETKQDPEDDHVWRMFALFDTVSTKNSQCPED